MLERHLAATLSRLGSRSHKKPAHKPYFAGNFIFAQIAYFFLDTTSRFCIYRTICLSRSLNMTAWFSVAVIL
jgi:hypothetical protein